MIDPKAIISYAQYNEDIILLALLGDIKKGFYVDVGANYPTVDSVTKTFYDKGWSGINIEPIKGFHEELAKARPKESKATLREYSEIPGHSTFNEKHKKIQKSRKFIDYEVDILPLAKIFAEYKVKKIDFLKVDVEGFEYEVIKGNDWQKYRPTAICIEANHQTKDWRSILAEHRYKIFIRDGLNEYYVAQEAWDKTLDFDEKVVGLDYHALKQHQYGSWQADSKELLRLHGVAHRLQQHIDHQDKEIDRLKVLSALSMSYQPWLTRLKRAMYGLTIDWLQFKSKKKR